MRSRFTAHPAALAAACLLMAAMAASAHGASLFGLGHLPGLNFYSYATGVSADGSVVVGTSSGQAFRWTSGGGMVGLGDLPGGNFISYAFGVSADGSVVVGSGTTTFSFPNEAFRWTSSGGMVGLGHLPGFDGGYAFGVSADGSVIVGSNGSAGQVAFRWTGSGGMLPLGVIRGGRNYTSAYGVSADGSVIVGLGDSASGGIEAFRWTSREGMVGLGDLPGGSFFSFARGVSADGSVVVGSSSGQAFRWTSRGGMVGLGHLPGFDGSTALGVSADGSTIVGMCQHVSGEEAFIWDATNGMRSVRDVLSPSVGVALNGWTLSEAMAISADGGTVVGLGTNPSGNQEAWVAYLGAEVPEPASWLLVGIGLAVVLAARHASRTICRR